MRAIPLCLCAVVAMVTMSYAEQTCSKSSDEAPDCTAAEPQAIKPQLDITNFLMSNWRDFFHSIDVNHDNVVNKKDAEVSRSQYVFLTTQRGQQDTAPVDKLDRWWAEYVFKGAPDQMTEQEYMDYIVGMFVIDKAGFEAFCKASVVLVWEALDLNSDNYISWEEFDVAYTVFGHTAVARDYAAFLAYKPIAMVPLARFIDAWTDLAIDADPAGPTIVKDTFIKDGFE